MSKVPDWFLRLGQVRPETNAPARPGIPFRPSLPPPPATPVEPLSAVAPAKELLPLPVKPTVTPSADKAFPACRISAGPPHRVGSMPYAPQSKPNDARWSAAGERLVIGGYIIADGMVYSGGFLSASPGGGTGINEAAPCLINPLLEISRGPSSTDFNSNYWPSYTHMTPEHRNIYLGWLSRGKKDTNVSIGYVFVYFYGLERRLLVDAIDAAEEAILFAEVGRLRKLFGSNPSFARYSLNLIRIVQLRRLLAERESLANWQADLDSDGNGSELPLRIKMAVKVALKQPLSFDEVMATVLWLRPAAVNLSKDNSLARARAEFVTLARVRFALAFPDGFLLPNKHDSVFYLNYKAASRHLEISLSMVGGDGLPEPLTLSWTPVADLFRRVSADLEPYVRFIGKDPNKARGIAASTLLPTDIAHTTKAAKFREWLQSLQGSTTSVPLDIVGDWCFGGGQDYSGTRPMKEMSKVLERYGYGLEPDAELGGGRPDSTVVLFPTADADGRVVKPSPDFNLASLAAEVIRGTGDVSEEAIHLVGPLASGFGLSESETRRLEARCRLSSTVTTPARLKAIAGVLRASERTAIAQAAASAANANGEVTRAVMAAMEKMADAFSIPRQALYSLIHNGTPSTTGDAVPRNSLKPARMGTKGQHASAGAEVTSPEAFAIDMTKVAAITQETRAVAAVLSEIYVEEEGHLRDKPVVPPTCGEANDAKDDRFPGLDGPHSGLLDVLSTRPTWTHEEFAIEARKGGLMPEGALGVINEWAFDVCDEEAIEESDVLNVFSSSLWDTYRR